jgi:hypothetical protein
VAFGLDHQLPTTTRQKRDKADESGSKTTKHVWENDEVFHERKIVIEMKVLQL